jgi:prolyl oligopeptidase
MTKYPHTAIRDVRDVLHGEEILDPYRWLEDGGSFETKQWTERQNAFTEAYLSQFPGRSRIRARLEKLLAIGVLGTPTPARGRYFYIYPARGNAEPSGALLASGGRG